MKDEQDVIKLMVALFVKLQDGLQLAESGEQVELFEVEGLEELSEREKKVAASFMMRAVECLMWVTESDSLNPNVKHAFDETVECVKKIEKKFGKELKYQGLIKFSEN